jgi:hypothetical protein
VTYGEPGALNCYEFTQSCTEFGRQSKYERKRLGYNYPGLLF